MSPSTSGPLTPTRRHVLAGAGAALAALTAAGCGASGRPTVTFYQSKPEAISYFKDLTEKFTASQDRFRILHDTATNLSASFVRDNPPDLGCLNYNLEMGRYMERGALSDLADMPEASTIREDVLDLGKAYASYAGRTSVIPYSVTAASVIYNRQIFADNGVEVPTTWDEFLTVCNTFRDAGITPIYSTYRDPWTIAQGVFDYTVGGMIDVQAFFAKMNELGADVGPDSEVSFAKTLREPVQRMLEITAFSNADAESRGYADGNTAMAQGKAAMYFQGTWALAEIEKAETGVDLGTFPLPVTDDPADLKVRVNIDLSLWVPEKATHPDGAREFISYLMQPEIQDAYNAAFLAFGTTKDAPPVTDSRIVEMQGYYDRGQYSMGASQFIPFTIPSHNYIQSIVTGSDAEATLRRLDSDWARLAYRA
ncbi:ABC transporter substrate-binding protein [Brachybacterium sp. AOP25-B2-12]|uniref:ABC transporter substrate-binding protein n=1 Tax=Brachybacterium sp. AOP25-B2-12 TaxID=3457710 RepID=UPI0040332155